MDDFGANPALAKAEPVARLGPSGFDPGEDMLERIAYAMFDCYRGYDAKTQEMLWQRERYLLMRQAERALKALRDPTLTQCQAALEESRKCGPGLLPVGFELAAAERVWRTMIDASLARIEAGTDETRNAAQPVGREPDKAPKGTSHA